jgi:cell division topological specificity factor
MNLRAFLNALIGKKDSKDIAKERLRLVLVHDRSDVTPEFLDKIKEEIILVISKYMEIDEQFTEVALHRSDKTVVLEANLAVKSIRRN